MALLICGPAAHTETTVGSPRDLVSVADRIARSVEEAAQRFAVPEAWIRAIMQAESNGEIRALSPKGAIGLMQIMPQTWAELRARYRLGADPFDAHDNIFAGSAYLRDLWDRYGAPGFLAAYNAGPARYEDHLASGRPLPPETQIYIAKLAPALASAKNNGLTAVVSKVRPWTEAPLFTGDAGRRRTPPARSNSERMESQAVAVDDHPAAFTSRSDGLFIATLGESSRPRSRCGLIAL